MSAGSRVVRAVVAGAAALSLGLAAGCAGIGEDEAPVDAGEESATLGDRDLAYDGAYGNHFVRTLNDYTDNQVALTGTVHRVISPDAFSLGGESVDELLVVNADRTAVQKGDRVRVSGTVHRGLDLEAVESGLGRQLQETRLARWDSEPYVMAEGVQR